MAPETIDLTHSSDSDDERPMLEDTSLLRASGRHYRPKVYRIDLSLPPAERYKKLAADFKDEIACLEDLARDLIADVCPASWNPKYIFAIGKRLLRRVYHREETQEIEGIAAASGVDKYLLVAFNVLLDALMGCSSGGIRASADGRASTPTRILHYRTLDWAMDPLRRLVVQLDYVREPRGQVVARSITYAGYVGVLTGVREQLSISLNYRCTVNDTTTLGLMKLRWHQVAVVLGLRPSLPSILRGALFGTEKSYEQTIHDVETSASTIAYLIFSNGQHVTILEKDYGPCVRHDSDDFLAVTNHDITLEAPDSSPSTPSANQLDLQAPQAGGKRPTEARAIFDGLAMEESIQRRHAMVHKVAQCSAVSRSRRFASVPRDANVLEWVEDWPITNEMTHYGAVMDPTSGSILYASVWPEPAVPVSKPQGGKPFRGSMTIDDARRQ